MKRQSISSMKDCSQVDSNANFIFKLQTLRCSFAGVILGILVLEHRGGVICREQSRLQALRITLGCKSSSCRHVRASRTADTKPTLSTVEVNTSKGSTNILERLRTQCGGVAFQTSEPMTIKHVNEIENAMPPTASVVDHTYLTSSCPNQSRARHLSMKWPKNHVF